LLLGAASALPPPGLVRSVWWWAGGLGLGSPFLQIGKIKWKKIRKLVVRSLIAKAISFLLGHGPFVGLLVFSHYFSTLILFYPLSSHDIAKLTPALVC